MQVLALLTVERDLSRLVLAVVAWVRAITEAVPLLHGVLQVVAKGAEDYAKVSLLLAKGHHGFEESRGEEMSAVVFIDLQPPQLFILSRNGVIYVQPLFIIRCDLVS